MATLDGKFDGEIRRRRDGRLEEEFVVFVPRDNLLLPLLDHYALLCRDAGCDDEQISAVCRLRDRVEAWRYANPDKCKKPDAAHGECP